MQDHQGKDKTRYSCVTFRVIFEEKSCIYANLYSLLTGEPEYWSFGPALNSHDGEYRERFCEWKLFDDAKKRWPKALAMAEELVVRLMSEEDIHLHADLFYSSVVTDTAKTIFENYLKNSRLPIEFLTLCFAVDQRRILAGNMPGHANTAYLDLISSTLINDAPPIGSAPSLAKFGLGIGQKMFSIPPEGEIGDINELVWRELYAGKNAHSLVTSKLTSSFPALGEWFFICNSHKELFDNEPCRQRAMDNELAVLATSEWVGETVANSRKIIDNLSAEFQERLLFEFLYGIYRLGATAGIVHGDLHLNNITIKELDEPTKFNSFEFTDDRAFSFLPSRVSGYIIDFSRAILDPEKVALDFGKEYAEEFIKMQNDRIIELIATFYPKMKVPRLNYSGLWKALTCMDVQILMCNINLYFGYELAKKIATRAKEILVKIFNEEPEEFEWPAATILNEFFYERLGKITGGLESNVEEDSSWMFED